jgi:archaemetzincin
LPPDHRLLEERIRKEALHELGHTFGLVHCQAQECVMRSSSSVEDIDLKGADFCAECAESLRTAS